VRESSRLKTVNSHPRVREGRNFCPRKKASVASTTNSYPKGKASLPLRGRENFYPKKVKPPLKVKVSSSRKVKANLLQKARANFSRKAKGSSFRKKKRNHSKAKNLTPTLKDSPKVNAALRMGSLPTVRPSRVSL
jgi:hypothetical protein